MTYYILYNTGFMLKKQYKFLTTFIAFKVSIR